MLLKQHDSWFRDVHAFKSFFTPTSKLPSCFWMAMRSGRLQRGLQVTAVLTKDAVAPHTHTHTHTHIHTHAHTHTYTPTQLCTYTALALVFFTLLSCLRDLLLRVADEGGFLPAIFGAVRSIPFVSKWVIAVGVHGLMGSLVMLQRCFGASVQV